MIRCIGRRYPDAPYWSRQGCVERNPPYVFQVKGSSFTGFWAAFNDVWMDVEIDLIQPGPVTGFDATVQWERVIIAGRIIRVRKILLAGPNWRLEVAYRHGFPGGAVAEKIYTFDVPWFERWEAEIPCRVFSTTPDWTFGGAITSRVRPATYALLPAGFCELP